MSCNLYSVLSYYLKTKVFNPIVKLLFFVLHKMTCGRMDEKIDEWKEWRKWEKHPDIIINDEKDEKNYEELIVLVSKTSES